MRIDETTYVDRAENVIQELLSESKAKSRNGKPNIVTTSKIRNLLAMTADIFNQVLALQSDTMNSELIGRTEYLRIRFAYECGRVPEVKELVEKAEILHILKEIGDSKQNYIVFNRYMEALVAFRKYYGPKEQD